MLREINRHRSLLLAFATRDFSTRYRSSAMGWMWSLAQPIATLVMFTLVFTFVFRVQAPPLGNGRGASYAAYLFTGLVTWNLITGLIDSSMTQLRISSELLRKVAFPAWAPVIGGAAIPLLQTGMELVILCSLLLMFLNIGWTWLLAVPILMGAVMFGLGIGLMLAGPNARYGDVRSTTTVVLGILYFLTPILYPASMLEAQSGILQWVVRANPFSWYVTSMHDVMYSLVAPPLWEVAALLLVGYLTLWAGFAAFQRGSEGLAEL